MRHWLHSEKGSCKHAELYSGRKSDTFLLPLVLNPTKKQKKITILKSELQGAAILGRARSKRAETSGNSLLWHVYLEGKYIKEADRELESVERRNRSKDMTLRVKRVRRVGPTKYTSLLTARQSSKTCVRKSQLHNPISLFKKIFLFEDRKAPSLTLSTNFH